MRLVLSIVLLVVCAPGCGPTEAEGRGSGQRSRGPSETTPTSSTGGSRSSAVSESSTALPSSALINSAVTRRARAALKDAGAEELVRTPGYEGEVNKAFTGVWCERPFRAYAVPTKDAVDGELTVVSRSDVEGHSVEVMRIPDGAVRLLRFTRGPDTWLLASLTPNLADSDRSRSFALATALLQ